MPRLVLIIIAVFQLSNVFAQKSFNEFIDSTIAANHLSEKDWAIGYYRQQGGYIPIYDSLGNIEIEPEFLSTIIIFNIKNVFYVQRLQQCYDNDTCFHASRRVKLPKAIPLNYTVDSIQQAKKEWIYQYIYQNDEGAYVYQEDSPHSPAYVLSFFTSKINTREYFTRICLEETIIPAEMWPPKNLNVYRNRATFTYRAFVAVKKWVEENRKLIPID